MSTDEPTQPIWRFVRHREPRALPLACQLYLTALFAVLYYGTTPIGFTSEYWAVLGAYLFFVVLLAFEPFRFLQQRLLLEEQGLRVGKRLLPIEQISRMDRGPRLALGKSIRIIPTGHKRGFFSLSGKPHTVAVPNDPSVCSGLIPAILRMNPDVVVSDRLRHMLDDPDSAGAPVRWLVITGLTAAITVLSLAFTPRFQNLPAFMLLGGLLTVIASQIGTFAVTEVRTVTAAFVKYAFNCSILIGLTAGLAAFSNADIAAFELLAAVAVTIIGCAMAAFILRRELSVRDQCLIFTMLLVPLCLYARESAGQWPVICLDRVQPSDTRPQDSSLPFWSRSGHYLTTTNASYLVDLATMRQVNGPPGDPQSNVIWLDDQYMIRKVKEDDVSRWRLFNINETAEYVIAEYPDVRISARQPVCPQTKHLVGMISDGEDSRRLWIWDLPTMHEVQHNIKLRPGVAWGGAHWVKPNVVLLLGVLREATDKDNSGEPYELEIARVDVDCETVEYYGTDLAADRWWTCSKWNQVVGTTSDANGITTATFVDVITGRTWRPVSDTVTDLTPVESASIVAVVTLSNGISSLKLVNFENRTVTDVCAVPRHSQLAAVSPDGRLALFSPSDFMSFTPLTLVHIPTGTSRRIRRQGGFMSPRHVWLQWWNPSENLFSPDSSTILMDGITVSASDSLRLIHIPQDWPCP